jgi:hypothetical protein
MFEPMEELNEIFRKKNLNGNTRHLFKIFYFKRHSAHAAHGRPSKKFNQPSPAHGFFFKKIQPMGWAGPGWAGLGWARPSPLGPLLGIALTEIHL